MLDGRKSTLGTTWNAVTLTMFACCITNCAFEAKSVSLNWDSDFSWSDKTFSDTVSQEVPNSELQSSMEIYFKVNEDAERAHSKTLPRCNVELFNVARTGVRSKRYALKGSRWNYKHLTYKISSYPRGLNKRIVDEVIARAFSVFSNYTDLTFSLMNGQVEIEIRFESGDHGDGMPFDGRNAKSGTSNQLAHAFYPKEGGDIHFDRDENWTLDGNGSGYDLFYVALHEIGHSLGLGHSNVDSALMAKQYRNHDPNFTLNNDDIMGLHALYGPKTRDKDIDICKDTKIDTIFDTTDGHVYIFKGEHYWKVTKYGIPYGYPKLITKKWKGLPSNIDAAFTYRGRTYFFKGSKYWIYSDGKMHDRYPRKISKGFPGIPDNIDAATASYKDKPIYFYKGAKFWRFDPTKWTSSKCSNLTSISLGLRENVDAVFFDRKIRHTIFFKNTKYYRLVDNLQFLSFGPYDIGSNWFNCADQESNDVWESD